MKLSATTIDNITEVLTRIVEFTDRRREVLTRNLFDYQSDGFQPKDLPVCEFAECIDVDPVIDSKAQNLLKRSTKDYLQMQIHKLSENLMNNRIAVELLKQKQQRSSF